MTRKLIIGVDEAGYGPNLGPLVVAASVWRVDQNLSETQLCRQLQSSFQPRAWKPGSQHTPLGDSKLLYSRAQGLDSLEMGLLTMLSLCTNRPPADFPELLASAGCQVLTGGAELPPWYNVAQGLAVPKNVNLQPSIRESAVLRQADLAALGIELVKLTAVVTSEPSFNSSLQTLGSKGQLLSACTLRLVAELLEGVDVPAEVYCDRQGGRKNYMPILLDAMPDAWFSQTNNSDARCSYRSQGVPSRDIHFSVKGDSYPPAGLASMLAKYLRERFMEAFNQYWIQHVPDLKPTAGYPQDAKRFAESIRPIADELGISQSHWWREK